MGLVILTCVKHQLGMGDHEMNLVELIAARLVKKF
jgi:hypothetical protein